MQDCIFCKIVAGEIPSTKVYEDESVLAFRDINAQAPTHVLVIPKQHLESVMALQQEHAGLLAHLFEVIRKVAEQEGIAGSGFRVISNVGKDGAQTVKHLHFHVLGGKQLGETLA